MNKHKFTRKTLIACLILLVICIIGLSVVYATLSVSLNIDGSGTINASNWDISLSYIKGTKTGSASFTTPSTSGSTITNYSVSLTKPGDSVSLFFRVHNNGTLNGEIVSIISNVPNCVSSGGNLTDEELICDNLNIDFAYYYSGYNYDVAIGDVINTEGGTCLNEFGSSDDDFSSTDIVLTISLDSSMNTVSSSGVTISNLSHELIYTQTDKECTSGSIDAPN